MRTIKKGADVLPSKFLFLLISPISKEIQQQQEKIYEVKIERQGTHYRALAHAFRCLETLCRHCFQFLCVISGQPYEYQDAQIRDDIVKNRTVQKHIHHRSNDEAKQRHDQQIADAGEVAFSSVSI